jgi:hypothetical protein
METLDLKNIIAEADRKELIKRGLNIEGKLFQKLFLEKYGTIDLISFKPTFDDPAKYVPGISNKTGELTVIEASSGKINFFTLRKACMNIDSIKLYRKSIADYGQMTFNILLIGNEVETLGERLNIWPPAPEELQRVTFIKFSFSISGLYFDEVVSYQRTGEGFKKEKKRRITKPEETVPGELINMAIHKN